MVRRQIQLTEDQARSLRAAAAGAGISVAEAIRRCVDRGIAELWPDRDEAFLRAERLVGIFTDPDGATDLSSNHDKYLDEAAR